MTKKLHSKNRVRLVGHSALFCLIVTGFLSCGKKVDLEGAHLTGVFHGNDCSNNAAPNVVVRETDDKKSIVMSITPVGLGGCVTTTDVTGILKGVDSVVFQKQSYADKCGNQITAFGSGKISGHAYQYYIKFIADVSGKKDSIVKCFGGVK